MTDQELEAIARGEGGAGMDMDTDGAGGDATRRLLGDYQTPARYTATALESSMHMPFKPGHSWDWQLCIVLSCVGSCWAEGCPERDWMLAA